MRKLRNAAVAGLGVWAGEMAAGFITPLLPKGQDGAVKPWLEKATRYTLTGFVVILALRTLGSSKRKG